MILDDIVQVKKAELKKAKQIRKIVDLKAKARNAAPLKPFDLRQKDAVSIIAEIKRASPVKGVFKADLDPAEQATKYREGGARAISVLTDEQFFKGSVDDLRAARNAAGLPILRKDFVIDEYQLWEARVMLADAALLIVRILGQGPAARLHRARPGKS
jgi:indole-3-glycerol phosphate synthase